MEWTGNLTLKVDEKEGILFNCRYLSGSIEVEEYGSGPYPLALMIASNDKRAKVMIRFSYEDYKKLTKELAQKL